MTVAFNKAKFVAVFTQFANVSDPVLNWWFDEATDFLDNSPFSIVKNESKRERLLYLLVAHIGTIAGNTSGGGLVGRVSSATEGSVSISATLDGDTSKMNAYFAQTPYGLQYWQATTAYRRFVYVGGSQC